MAASIQRDDGADESNFIAKNVEDLLCIATFLTTQQCLMKRQSLGWISVQDVATTLQYRSLLRERQDLEARVESYVILKPQFVQSVTKPNIEQTKQTAAEAIEKQTPFHDPLIQVRKSLQEFEGTRIPMIHEYWQEVEILFTQLLVTEDVRLNGNLYWNMPLDDKGHRAPDLGPLQPYWSRYVQESQQVHGDALFPPLSVLPDAFTWQSWARGLSMGADEDNETRHPARNDPSEKTDSPYSSIFLLQPLKSMQGQPRYIYTRGDLLALVQQSRHCSASLRHLLQIFVVTRKNNANKDNDIEGGNPYAATLKGNHRYTHRRVQGHTPLVEKLVAHAIQQQMLVITPTVRSHVQKIWQREQADLLQRQKDASTGENGERPTKRRKVSETQSSGIELVLENSDESIALPYACQHVLLRTWAFRHAAVLSPLFSVCPSPKILALLHLDPASISYPQELKAILAMAATSDPSVDKTDRSFDRVDRRIACGKYESGDNSVNRAILNLLQAWKQVRSHMEEGFKQENCSVDSNDGLTEAIQDWEARTNSFDEIRESKGIVKAAMAFLEDDVNADDFPYDAESFCAILSSCPAPWAKECRKPSCNPPLGETDIRFCVACGQWQHDSCAEGHTAKMQSFCKSFQPLHRLFSVRPLDASPPATAPGYWQQLEFIVERKRDENSDQLPRLGLKLFDTTKAEILLRKFENREILAWETAEYNGLVPVKVDHAGFMIGGFTSEDNNFCQLAGMKSGDVIVSVQMLDFDDDSSGGKLLVPRIFDLTDASQRRDATNSFSLPCTKMHFIVQRPDVDILNMAQDRWEAANESANMRRQVKLSMPEFWFCGNCPSAINPKDEPIAMPDKRHMARLCRAVVRRLCMQPYAKKLYYEDHVQQNSLVDPFGHKCCISLRRLDLLLTSLVRGQDLDRDLTSPLFFQRERLSWADDSLDPRILLCQGIDLMASGESNHPTNDIVRQNLLADFTMYFSGWCLSASLNTTHPAACPPFYLYGTFPWDETRLCSCCSVRKLAVEQTGYLCDICKSADDIHEQYLRRFDRVLEGYERRASHVGSMVVLPPQDPTVLRTAGCLKKVNVPIEDFSRPVEFVVAAYIPVGMEKAKNLAVANGEGLYYLLPIINPTQLKFLTDRCRPGNAEDQVTSAAIQRWFKNGLLDLEGVLCLSYEDLKSKLDCTRNIVSAISNTVIAMGKDKTMGNSLGEPQIGEDDRDSLTPEKQASMVSKTLESNRRLIAACSASSFFTRLFDWKMKKTPGEPANDPEFDLEVDIPMIPEDKMLFNFKKANSELLEKYRFSFPYANSTNLLYSDLFFPNVEAKDFFESAHTAVNKQDFPAWEVHTITLEHSNFSNVFSRCFSDVGWGLEILVEASTREVFVGRVDKNGIAFQRGLRPQDKLLNINGKRLQSLSLLYVAYITAFTGLPVENLPPDNPTLACLCALDECSARGRVPGPLIIQVSRQLQTNSERAAQLSHTPTTEGNQHINETQVAVLGRAQTLTAIDDKPTSKSQVAVLGEKGSRSTDMDDEENHAEQQQGHDVVVNPSCARKILDYCLRRAILTPDSRPSDLLRAVNKFIVQVRSQGGNLYSESIHQSEVRVCLNDEQASKELRLLLFTAIRERFAPQSRDAQASFPTEVDQPVQPFPLPNDHLDHVPNPLPRPSEPQRLFATQAPPEAQPTFPAGVNQVIEPIPLPKDHGLDHVPSRLPLPAENYHYLVKRIDLERYQSLAPGLHRLDLHVCGPDESSFTLAELGVLLRAILENRIMLGFRLLMPRYRIRIIEAHLAFLSRMDMAKLRRVPDGLWTRLVKEDFHRSQKESPGSAKLLVDPDFQYTIPDSHFPIDNLFERYWVRLDPGAAVLDHPDRIRGGGRSEDEAHVPLSSKPVVEWPGTLVYSRIMYESRGSQKPVTVTGTVVSVCDNGNVRVEVLSHMKRGAVDPYSVELEIDSLFIAQEGSKYWDQAQKAKSFHGSSHTDADMTGNQSISQNLLEAEPEAVSEFQIEVAVRHPFFGTIRMSSAERARYLLRSIDDENFPFVLLGHLPDWRAVYWHRLDRDAIYVSPLPTKRAVVDFLDRLSTREMSIENQKGGRVKYICNWRCGKNGVLDFDGRSGLQDHYCDKHSAVSSGLLGDCDRIASVDGMSKLLDALVAVVYKRFSKAEALWGDHAKFLVRVPSAEQEASVARCWVVATSVEKESLMTLVNLSTVFNTEQFRCSELCLGQDQIEKCDIEATGAASIPKLAMLFPRARRLIVSIIEELPAMLVQEPFRNHISAAKVECWGKDNRGYFSSCLATMARSSQSIFGLIQVLSFITTCVDHELFPDWWKSEGGGWKSVQPLLMDPSLSNLILYAQVFQEAISSAIQVASSNPNLAFAVDIPPLPSKYMHLAKNIASEAEGKGINLWQGGDEDSCFVCGHGEDFFCCSFCPNVMCKNCYDSWSIPEVEAFVCHACIVDIRGCKGVSS